MKLEILPWLTLTNDAPASSDGLLVAVIGGPEAAEVFGPADLVCIGAPGVTCPAREVVRLAAEQTDLLYDPLVLGFIGPPIPG